MVALTIRWQRLVDGKGNTCDRCGSTGGAVREGAERLSRALAPLGVEVVLEEAVLSPSEFARDTLASNRIWVDGKPLEEWLSAEVGSSRCCSACGDADCRTVTVDGRSYEAVPPELVVKAGLLAAAVRLPAGGEGGRAPAGPGPPSTGTCCPPPAAAGKASPCCPGEREEGGIENHGRRRGRDSG